MKILLLSDLHIGNGLNFIDEDKNFGRIKDCIIQRWANDDDKPIILITGDITDSGTKRQYNKTKSIIDELMMNLFVVHMVPGNHDYGPKGNLALKRCFKRFKRILYGIEGVSYPYVKIQQSSNFKVAFIGLDSMAGECKDIERFFADGELGISQLEELQDTLDYLEEMEEQENQECLKIVFLHHHPFVFPKDRENFITLKAEKWLHALDDGKGFMELVSNKRIDILAFGHDHDHIDFSEPIEDIPPLTETYSINTILSCGKSTKRKDGSFPAWLIEIDANKNIVVTNPGLN